MSIAGSSIFKSGKAGGSGKSSVYVPRSKCPSLIIHFDNRVCIAMLTMKYFFEAKTPCTVQIVTAQISTRGDEINAERVTPEHKLHTY